MSNYLVTGGAGFIGSHIVERLLKDGHSVVVLDNFSSGKRENLAFVEDIPAATETVSAEGYSEAVKETVSVKGHSEDATPETVSAAGYPKAVKETVSGLQAKETVPKFKLLEGDIRDYSTCLRACEGVDFVLHQAALRSVPKSMERPFEFNEVNINGTLNMLKAAKQSGVTRFVFASSSSVYGDTDQFPEEESAYPLLISPYALTKLAGEYYCRIFSENFGLETVSLRYFNVFGPRQALDDEYAVVIPKFISCILNDEQPPIFGNGKQSRDFTYIDNVVQGNILAATVPGVSSQVFNIANGKDNTVLSIVDALNKIIGKSITPIFKPIRAGDVFRTFADISKAVQLLGYKPKIGFEEGLTKTVKYFEAIQLVSTQSH